MSYEQNTDTRTAEQIRTDIDRTRTELGGDVSALTGKVDPRIRARQLVTTAKAKTAEAASRTRASVSPMVRQAGQKASENWMPTAVGTLTVAAAATTVVVLQRRRAAKARAARNRWLPSLLSR